MTAIDIEKFNPKNGDKYSPNFYKWLRRHYRPEFSVVRGGEFDHLYVGEDEGWCFTGKKLMHILCKIGDPISCILNLKTKPTPVADFWKDYEERGRCAIDPSHNMRFVGDENRYQQNGDARTCRWCGTRQNLVTKTHEYQVWENQP